MRISYWSSDVCSSDLQRPVKTGLLLETGMAVVPVGAALHDVDAVMVGLAAVDAVEAQTGHAVHVRRQQDAVPVDRRLVAMDGTGGQGLADAQVDGRALPPAPQSTDEHTFGLQSLTRISYDVIR